MKKMLALVLALVLVMGLAVSASAIPIADTRGSVVVIGFGIDYSENKSGTNIVGQEDSLELYKHAGTGFFVGTEGVDPTYIITNYHVISDFVQYGSGQLVDANAAYFFGEQYKGYSIPVRSKIWVSYDEDDREEGYLVYADEETDFAILKVANPTTKRKPLKLRVAQDSMVGSTVYAVGYPGLSESRFVDPVKSMDIQSATVTQGTLGRIVLESGLGIKHLQSDCVINGGNSGGALVDDQGNVLGITSSSVYSGIDQVYYAVSIEEVLPFLRMYGVEFDMVGSEPVVIETEPPVIETEPAVVETEPAVVETEPPVVVDTMALEELLEKAAGLDTAAYKDFADVKAAVKVAEKALAGTQEDVDTALDELDAAIDALEPKADMMPIIIGAAAILVVAVVVVIIMSGKKKKTPARTAAPAPAPVPTPAPAPAPAPAPVPDNAGETAILSADTDILVNGGTLTRVKNSQRILVNAVEFVLGREAATCAYAILDNNAVGRTHAKIVVRGDKSYLVDLKSRNGTYLNGVRVNPQEENELKNGDRIRLASEEFEFHK